VTGTGEQLPSSDSRGGTDGRLQSLSSMRRPCRRFTRPGRRRRLVPGGPAVFCGMSRLIYAAECATAVAIIVRIVVL